MYCGVEQVPAMNSRWTEIPIAIMWHASSMRTRIFSIDRKILAMTGTVVFIALLHAVPVFVIAALTKSKVALTVAAIIAGIIGVTTGNPAYAIADLIGIAVAFWLGISRINRQKLAPPPQTEKPLPEAKKTNDSSWVVSIIGLAIVVAYFYNTVTNKPVPASPPVLQAPQASTVHSSQQVPSPSVKSGAQSQRVAKSEPVRDPWKEYDDRQNVMHKERFRLIETIAAKYPQLDPNSPSFDRKLWNELQGRIAVRFKEGHGPIKSISVALGDLEREKLLENNGTIQPSTTDIER
jgi:hypothetical protein